MNISPKKAWKTVLLPHLAHVSLAVLLAATLLACSKQPETVSFTGPTMGTQYAVKFLPPAAQDINTDALQAHIDEVLAEINQVMSTYDPNSVLSRFNQYDQTDWFAVTPELVTVIHQAQALSRLSDGAFDITVGPLVNLWGFGPDMGSDAIPSDAAIAKARDQVGYQQLKLRESPAALSKDRSDLYVDLSAIAKGYAVDRVAALLDERGIANYLVEIGGELRLKGHNARSASWQIAVEQPDPGGRKVQRILAITDCGLATSGDYRNFFIKDGQRYSHILDPRTGRPIEHRLASVTVLADSALAADGRATTLLALGPEDGLALAQEQGWAALLLEISAAGEFVERETPAFAEYLQQ